ncbi:MAG: aminotransferase class I/II-fold pyridoxal phosphate-dependent enzyme, partial [Pseudomonadota bacterium]
MNALDLPHPSARLGAINGDAGDGWEILSTARAAKAAGRDVVDLTIGDHDRTTPAPILDALEASARGGHTGYASVPGIDALRAAIAARVTARTGVATTAENVLVTAGGQAALFAAATGVADPGDTLLYIDPYYATYPGTIRGVGAVPVPVQALPESGFQPRASDIAAVAE